MLKQLLCFVAVLGLSHSLTIPADVAESGQAARIGEYTRYLLYTQSSPFTSVELDTSNIAASLIANTPVIIIVHGHQGSAQTSLNPDLKDETLTHYDYNVVVVDWSMLSSGSYDIATTIVPIIGEHLSTFVGEVISAGFTFEQIHLIGFDLGAHVCGFAGRALDGKIQQITGLSPRGNDWTDTRGPLTKSDAVIVEVIHTSNNLGIDRPIGDRDFFINNGRVQPGCSNHQCHHNRSFQIMTASIGHTIQGNLCNTVAEARANTCRGRTLHVGGYERKIGSGIFRANTRAVYPF